MKTARKQLIISFHDLHPGSWDSCRRFMDRCRQLGANKMSLLVIPRYHGAPPFTENEEFVDWLKDLPSESFDLCLHGLFHRAESVRGGWFQQFKGNVYTTGEGEFYQLTRRQARKKLEAGIRLFHAHDLPLHGFTPPAWLVGQEAGQAIRESGFLYSTLWDGVELPSSNAFVKAPTLVYSSRNAWRRFVSKIWITFFHAIKKNTHVLRFAVHPIDFEHPDIEAHVYRTLEKVMQNRECSTYLDLIPPERQIPVTPADG